MAVVAKVEKKVLRCKRPHEPAFFVKVGRSNLQWKIVGHIEIVQRVLIHRRSVADARLGVNGIHFILGQPLIAPCEPFHTIGTDSIDKRKIGADGIVNLFFNIDTICCNANAVQKHHAKRQRRHNECCAPFVAAEICPGQM